MSQLVNDYKAVAKVDCFFFVIPYSLFLIPYLNDMIDINEKELTDRFMRYVMVDTQSDPTSDTHPTTEKQKDLSKILFDELKKMGLAEVELDEFGYVYATVPSTSD